MTADEMNQEANRATPSKAVRVGGPIVVLATLSTAVLTTLFFLKPWLFLRPWIFPPGHPGVFLGKALFGSLIVSGVGALLMFAATKRRWWLLGLAVVAAAVVLLVLVGVGMGPAMH